MTSNAISISKLLARHKRIVIKFGSSSVTDGEKPRQAWLNSVAEDVAELVAAGKEVILVTSGAVALGKKAVAGYDRATLAHKQTAAIVGQPLLMKAWDRALEPHGLTAGQVLLNNQIKENDDMKANVQAAINVSLAHKIIPIVNENDAVHTQELQFGDNDTLAATTGAITGASCVILMSDIDGLYTDNPHKNPKAELISTVPSITSDVMGMANGSGENGVGTGGMLTKLLAAQQCQAAGISMIIANGQANHPVQRLFQSGKGTLFPSAKETQLHQKMLIVQNIYAARALALQLAARKERGLP